MEDRIIKFIAALRSQGVRVSLAESADAFFAIDKLGITQKEAFRLSLRSTLIKNNSDLSIFDQLFPLFFGDNYSPPMSYASEDLTPVEAEKIYERKWCETEYLGLYQRIVWGKIQNVTDQDGWIVWDHKEDTAVTLRRWLTGG